MAWFFVFFFVSGFCSLVYEVVWLRLAMATFGVTTPLVSIVLSVFMGGLALGSWGGGALARKIAGPDPMRGSLRAYGLAELIIGLSAFVVPAGLSLGQALLARAGERVAWGSSFYYLASGACITAVLLPFTAAMGTTFPLAMSALRGRVPEDSERSFSTLYLMNVFGAASGTLVCALFLIELLGFHRTLLVTGGFNAILAVTAFALSQAWRTGSKESPRPALRAQPRSRTPAAHQTVAPSMIPWLLFATGLISMALEVVWVRQYTPFLGTVVYAFATILVIYLFATFIGTAVYRRWMRSRPLLADRAWMKAWWLTGLFALLPLAVVDPRLQLPSSTLYAAARVALGIAPFCAGVGFITPMLIDGWSAGEPARAGRAYAFNIAGCILGPLIAGFLLLPFLGERFALVALALPLILVGSFSIFRSGEKGRASALANAAPWLAPITIALAIVILSRDYETRFPRRTTRRDYEATVIATGEGMQRQLLVNGVGMTNLTPITKMMVHLPLTMMPRPPKSSLVICFGMGTSFRSAVSWAIPCTAVELIPSVPRLFGYYHADAATVVQSPGARIVIDDGRRLLARTHAFFDLITVDPPPPAEAAASSLLYSRDFYRLARSRLSPDGIMAVWFPGGELTILCSIAKSLSESFPHVRVFRSVEGWGFHFLASSQPIPGATPAQLAARLPRMAAADLVEWGPAQTPEEFFRIVLEHEVPLEQLVNLVPGTPTLRDDRPVNEYYFTRRWLGKMLP